MNQEARQCQNCKKDFVIEAEDFDFYEKMKVPAPTFCPECRLIRRLVWRNESTLYKRKCDAPDHSEEIISMFSKDKPFVVYDQKFWWSDQWEKGKVFQDYDFSKPFLKQFRELMEKSPLPSLSTNYSTVVNSEYSNWAGDLKNCYLVVDADFIENGAYGSGWVYAKDCLDNDFIRKCELCYFSFDLENCYQTFYSVSCKDCNGIWFSKDCNGLSSCFGCVNLRNKKYHILNEPYSKEDYEKKLRDFNLNSYAGIEMAKKEAGEFWIKHPKKSYRGFQNLNSKGDYIYHSKNVSYGFLITDVEDSKFVALTHSKPTKDCYDYTDWGDNVNRIYDSIAIGYAAHDIKFSHLVFNNVRDIEYSYFCSRSSDLLGCVGLTEKHYCILNKQYSKEDYFSLREKIIKHMDDMPYVDKGGRVYKYGEFFPPEISPFSYNEAVVQEYFPLTKDEALGHKLDWKDAEERGYQITKHPSDLPYQINEVDDNILKEIIGCEHKGECNEKCTTAFRITPYEWQFYKRFSIPLPRLCPNCRHYERLRQRNPLKLWHRKCMCDKKNHGHEGKCPNEFETSYAPDRKEIVYCESCYNNEVA